ncbi:MAG: beta strand repeat-containing protein [Luteolibacter sp.]
MKPNAFNTLVSSTTALAFVLGAASSQAQVTLYAEYHLGEALSLSGVNKLPQDSSGNTRHFPSQIGGSTALVQTTGVSATGSTAYLDTSMAGNQGFFFNDNALFTGLGTNNFAFGIYARGGTGATAAAAAGDVFQLGANSNNTYKLSLESTGWRASSANISFIGTTAAFTTNTWVHLALIRNNGQTAFFVNGVQQGGNFATAPTIGAPYLSQAPGNAANANFDGHIDEARIVTFPAGEPTANILSVLTNSVVVPPGNNGTWVSITDGLWSDDTKWQDAVIATDVDRTATFSASSGLIVVDLDSNRTIGNLVFSNSDYTISGANVLTLSASGTPGISVDTGLTATLDTTVGGFVGLNKTGLGTLILSKPNNSYSGKTTISGGILQITGRLGSGTYANAISISTGSTLQFSSSAGQTLSGAITGLGGITKDISGDLFLTNAGNTYSGITAVSAGRIQVGAATHLSSGATSIVQSGTGQIFSNSTATISNQSNISSIGYNEGDARGTTIGAIRLNGGTLSGPVTLSGNSRIGGFSGIAGTQTNTISGKITGGFGIDFFGGQNVDNVAQVIVLTNPANDYTGATTILNGTFGTANNLAGVSTTLRLGASGVIPDGASAGNVVFAIPHTNNNNTTLALDLFGSNETINGLTVNAGTFNTRITNTAAAANSVLTIGANDTTSSFSGTITDSGVGRTLAITKIGTGTLTLAGIHSYSGDTTVSDGTLTLGNPNPSNQASTVTVDTDAFLELNYVGTDTVGELVIGNTPKGVGEYGNSSSMFPVIPLSQITGSGTITVSPAGFSAWQTANVTSQTIDLDHDSDGVSNGVEFFLGGTTNTTGFTTPLPGVDKALDGTLSVTWAKAATYPAVALYGTDYSVETSETLTGEWTLETLGGGNITQSASDVKYTFPTPLGSKRFARLKVTGP